MTKRFEFTATSDNDIVTFAAGSSVSGAFRLGGMYLQAIAYPVGMQGTGMTVQVNFGGDTWYPARDKANVVITLPITAGAFVEVEEFLLKGAERLRFTSSVAQTVARDVIVVVAR